MSATKYIHIVDWVMHELDQNRLHSGMKLPSVRSLATQFQCSKNTVVKALEVLKQSHILYPKEKSGYFVVDDYKKPLTSNGQIDFLSAGPDPDVLPYEDFQHCMNQAIDRYKEQLFTYNDVEGLPSLRNELVRYLQNMQIFTKTDHIVVTSGSQQALHILSLMPFPNGKKTILIEEPTYFGMIDVLTLHHIPTIGIRLSNDGIDFEELERTFKTGDIKFFYIVPRCHNPLGHQYTNAEKKKIVALAKKYDVYIIEDDYLGELDSDPKADPLYAHDQYDCVIYVKSFSKVFLPGLRLAAVVLPDRLIPSFSQYKFSADFNTSPLTQGALEIYLRSGMFHYHIQRAKEVYATKLALAIDACKTHLPLDILYTKPVNGFYLTIFLPERINVNRLIRMLADRNVQVGDTSGMFLKADGNKAIRISISQVDQQSISEGIFHIAVCIKAFQQKATFNPLSLTSNR
ncbi:PLP-dependent aminotransferase family protein [Rossellomorea marisflavi]|uniref:aminotransferase-like domain-containing protein n=1 Tax=Rossellomorea marisflavi TaxID=189381 RepID=UPI003457E956